MAIPAWAADGPETAPPPAAQPATAELNWSLRLPPDDRIAYRGVASFDQAGMGTGSMLYPAPNLAGFFAALITHAMIIDTTRSNQKDRIQTAADRVLGAYQTVLTTYGNRELMQRGLDKSSIPGVRTLVEHTDKPGAGWFVVSLPVFSMTQDQSTLIVDNVIQVFAPGVPAAKYENTIRVVSMARAGPGLTAMWTDNGGEKLKEESASLLAESLDLALGEAARGTAAANPPHRTFRYLEGDAEKIERGQLIVERCNRVVIRNLRGWLMSVPVRPSAATHPEAACPPAPALPRQELTEAKPS